MASFRVPQGLTKIPLWKRQIPNYPLYYTGDPQNRVFLPLFWMKVIRPKEKVPPNYAHFIVHPQMSRSDIKQYLEKIYKVSVLHVRTELRRKEIKANMFPKGQIVSRKDVIWKEEEKYAYVQLKNEKFEYPDFFQQAGETESMQKQIKSEKSSLSEAKRAVLPSPGLGLPFWFR